MASPVVRATFFYGLRNHIKCVSAVKRISNPLSSFYCIQKRYCESIVSPDIKMYEPPYLVHLKPPLPVYDLANVQLRGYDFTVLERFGRFVHKVVIQFGLDINDTWPTPKQSLKVTTVKPNSNVIENTYQVAIFERNLQILKIPAARLSILVCVIQAALPPGVKFSFHLHDDDYEEVRYVPNLDLMELEDQLEETRRK